MCIIMAKRAGVELPSDDVLRTCWRANQDGGGYMFARDGKVEVRKGFTTIEMMLASLQTEGITKADAVCMHFRISTSGGVKPELCHPYPVVADFEAMKVLTFSTDLAVMHNGVLGITPETGVNDTMTFVKHVLAPRRNSWTALDKDIVFRMAISGSRLCFMDVNGTIQMVGQGWIKESDGLYYSNSGYKRQYSTYQYSQWDESEWYGRGCGNNHYSASTNRAGATTTRTATCPVCFHALPSGAEKKGSCEKCGACYSTDNKGKMILICANCDSNTEVLHSGYLRRHMCRVCGCDPTVAPKCKKCDVAMSTTVDETTKELRNKCPKCHEVSDVELLTSHNNEQGKLIRNLIRASLGEYIDWGINDLASPAAATTPSAVTVK